MNKVTRGIYALKIRKELSKLPNEIILIMYDEIKKILERKNQYE